MIIIVVIGVTDFHGDGGAGRLSSGFESRHSNDNRYLNNIILRYG